MDSKQDSNVEELTKKVETQDKEIELLHEELKKLRKCVRGVNVLGKSILITTKGPK